MTLFAAILLLAAGLIAGFIDSIAGGGGLITVPAFSIVLGPGVGAVATNKVAATAASAAALFIYFKNGHVELRGNIVFAFIVGAAAWLGSRVAPVFPPEFFKWMLVAICPLILWIVFHRDMWVKERLAHPRPAYPWRLWMAGFGCGFYDGIAGPGGGTLMFLSLLTFGRMPLGMALGTSKLANLASASVSLASYAHQGLVQWRLGGIAAGSIAAGALLGAQLGSQKSAEAARAALFIVVVLLLLRLISA